VSAAAAAVTADQGLRQLRAAQGAARGAGLDAAAAVSGVCAHVVSVCVHARECVYVCNCAI
jgi:hypothetical protein